MKNRLRIPCRLVYQGSREYTNKNGEQKTLYKFTDSYGDEVENTLSEPLTAEIGTVCLCVVQCGRLWNDTERRYNAYYKVLSAAPEKKEKEKK